MTDEQLYVHDPDPTKTNIPDNLKRLKRWIHVRGSMVDGKRTKYPCRENLKNIDAHNPDNWGEYSPNRTGLVMTGDNRILTVDGDGVGDPQYQALYDTIFGYFETVTYVEGSISNILDGKDKWHAICEGDLKNKIACPKLGIEIFPARQFILTTGQQTQGLPSTDQTFAINRLVKLMKSINEGDKAPVSNEEYKPATRITDEDHRDSMDIVRWFKREKKDLCPDNATFVRVVFCLKGCGWQNKEIDDLMRSEKGYDDKAWNRIKSIKPKTRQIANLVAYAKQDGYQGPALRHIKTNQEEKEDQEYCKIECDMGKYGDDVIIKQQLTPRLPARGDSVAISGRLAGGKTTHAFDMMKEVENLSDDMTNVLIVADMAEWQVRERTEEHGLDPDRFGRVDIKHKRHVHIDQLVEAIKEKVGDRQVGCVCIDNTRVAGRRLWRSIRRKDDPKNFDMSKDDCADTFCISVIDRIAQELDCVVIYIGHPAKNTAGKDKFPGSEQMIAHAGIAYRIYRINATNVEEIPKAIRERFRREKKSTKEYTLATVFKPRYKNVKDYWLKINKDGSHETVECADEEVDLEETDNRRSNKKKESFDEKAYIEKLLEFLRKNPRGKFGYNELRDKMGKDHPNIPYSQWVGVIHLYGNHSPASFNSRGKIGQLTYNNHNRRPVVFIGLD